MSVKRLTAEMLREARACTDQVARFDKAWPTGVVPTLASARRAVRLGLNVAWAARLLPPPARKAYDEAIAPAWKAYAEARATAWKAYDEATATAWKAYAEAIATAFVEAWRDADRGTR